VRLSHPAVPYFCTLSFVLGYERRKEGGFFMQRNKGRMVTRVLTTAALLAALSAVIGIVCKNLFTFNIYYRLTFENAPIILAGLLYGPVVGAMVGICADAVSCLMSTNPALNPIISLGAGAVGLMAGLAAKMIPRGVRRQTAVAVVLAHLIGQVGIKSVGKILYFGMPWQGIFLGLVFSAIVGVMEFLLICWMRSNKSLVKFMGGAQK
jgi:ECF transporter S component (folate family)